LHIGNIRLDNSSILAIETEKPNELSSLWKLMFVACKEQAQEGARGRFINFRKLREADPVARNKDSPR
jgi:hypothetical protein